MLLALAFTGGLASLGLEIAASRLLAPFFGSSTPIWGALIGLILLYLTVGYYVGGWAADRWPDPRRLYLVTALSAFFALLVPSVSRPVLLFSRGALLSFQAAPFAGALLGVILLFAPCVVLLGMVSPWVIRLRVRDVAGSGRAAGSVYALSTAGSILGAFLPAFWWIPSYGTRATIYGLGGLLLGVSVVGLTALRVRAAAAFLLLGLPLGLAWLPYGPVRPAEFGRVIYDGESEYGYIQVAQADSGERRLYLNEGEAIHSVYLPRGGLTGAYWDYPALAPAFAYPRFVDQKPASALVIGLAGGTVARQLTDAYGPVPIDGVEIDPRLIQVARTYFHMTEPNVHAVAEDGRYFLETSDRKYDLIVVDAYRQPYIPFQLATREFFESCRRHLTSHGVLMVNVARFPDDRRLLDAVTGTLDAVFVEVYSLDVPGYLNTEVFAPNQTIPSAAVRTNLEAVTAGVPALAGIQLDPAGPRLVEPHYPIWTDDLAPVEHIVDAMLLRAAGGR